MLLKEYLIDNCENEQLAIIINNLADAAILIFQNTYCWCISKTDCKNCI